MYDEMGQLTGSKPTGFRSSGRSLNYFYRGPEPIVFFEEEPAPTALNPEAVTRIPVATTRIPEGVENVLFLFTINQDHPQNGLKYNLQWLDTSVENFKPGHVSIFNTLPIELNGVAGKDEKQKLIKALPGLNPAINFYPQATLLLTLESKVEGHLRVYEDTITCNKEDTILLVLFPPRFPGSLSLGSKIISLPITPPEKNE
ncbi:MAG: hypothetical protein ACO3NW_06020 [Kiritimatiellia bacterium]